MRTALILPTAAIVAGLAATGLAAAAAPADTSTLPSITVNGTGDEGVAADAPTASLSAAYTAALGDALSAAAAKATFVAAREGVTLGALQTVTENTDVPTSACPGVTELPTAAGVSGKAKKNSKTKTKTKTKKPASKHAASKAQIVPVGGCSVPAQVTVTYLIGGPSAATTSTSTTTTSTAVSITATATPLA